MRLISHIFGAIVLSASSAAAAQSALEQLEATLRICASLRNNYERLSCYDRVAAQLDADTVQTKPVEVAPETLFGMSRKAGAAAPADIPEREELAAISSRVKALRRGADGSLQIELENGQTWRQLDSRPLRLKVGDDVTISRASFDSFRIAVPDNRFGRVRRVQ